MASTVFQFLDLAGVTELKNQLVSYIDSKDAVSIKGVGISGNKLSFYKTLPIEGASASYEVELPETDLSEVMKLVSGATVDNIATFGANGQVKDSGKKLADFYVKTDVDSLISAVEQKIAANTKSITDLDTNLNKTISDNKTELEGKIASAKDELQANINAVDGKTTTNANAIGKLEDLGTTQKGDLVAAINEVKASVSAGGEAGLVTVEESSHADYAKVYTIKQGGASVGTISIPKDMVVQSGEVITNPTGHPAGTYLKLVLANSENTEVFVNVGTLVDIYEAEQNASQVQLAINSSTREISASIVAGSVGASELADNAIVTSKVADGNITLAKLSTAVQASLAKADASASQASLDEEIARAGKAESDLSGRLDVVEEALGDGGNVEDKIADSLSDAKGYTDEEVGKVKDTIGTVETGKTVVQLIEEAEARATYNDTEVRSLIAQNNTSITNLTSTHNADKQSLQSSIDENANGIAANAEAIANLQTDVSNITAIPVSTITGLFS